MMAFSPTGISFPSAFTSALPSTGLFVARLLGTQTLTQTRSRKAATLSCFFSSNLADGALLGGFKTDYRHGWTRVVRRCTFVGISDWLFQRLDSPPPKKFKQYILQKRFPTPMLVIVKIVPPKVE
ncbi:hypothetical protein IQ07DRAFT_334976 [Pyrenochaeta sp. DS3sAY3a]|nr:hypothetical protein IQ07DRAFT_334976 [Pyrenochaeta sp. DS3sAY3a]